MTQSASNERHLSRDSLSHYLSSGAAAIVKIDGNPVLYLSIDPPSYRLALRAPASRSALPDLTAYQHLSAALVYWNDQQWSELRIDGPMLLDAYPLLCLVADKIQLDSSDFTPAVLAALASFRQLLASYARISEQQQVGMYGELLLLRHILRRLPPEKALAAWRGPDNEEHDFNIGDADVEVKTTTSEHRWHWISDATQLTSALGRQLWLVSIQLTGAGTSGASLSDIVSELQSMIPEAAKAEFQRKLSSMNWTQATAWLYTRKLRLRCTPEVYEVDEHFPALTTRRLTDAGIDHTRFIEIKYLLDLSGLAPAANPPALLANLASEQTND
jgi:Putative  PD-(D/E)XK family member, (DUF4420)